VSIKSTSHSRGRYEKACPQDFFKYLLVFLFKMYYNVYVIYYEDRVIKLIKKSNIPKNIIKRFHNAFLSLDLTKDLTLFDIKKMKGDYKRDYYRLRKGKYRAIFYYDKKDIYIIYIGKREEVYDLWQ